MTMPNKNPSPSEILAALKKHGVDVQTVKGWDTRGRSWKGPDGSEGLLGMVVHHTANPNATGDSGHSCLEWCTAPFGANDYSACQMLVGRGPGDTFLIQAGSGYHCGLGGPFPAIGVTESGFHGQFRLFGIECDDPGLGDTLTDYQVDQVSKIGAALAELCGWNDDLKTVITHGCWTDGCHGVNPKGPSPSIGRKNDTREGQWAKWDRSEKPEKYNAPFWREHIKAAEGGHAGGKAKHAWDGTIPKRKAVNHAIDNDKANKATQRVAARLYDLGYLKEKPKKRGVKFPVEAYKLFRAKQGWHTSDEPHLSAVAQKRMFGKDK
jgi:hypothetical protein